jgi:hypothetical protein
MSALAWAVPVDDRRAVIVHEHELAGAYPPELRSTGGVWHVIPALLTGVGWVRLQDMSLPSELPIVQAPMAGGASTPALTAAVADAGGYGFVAAGHLSAEGLREAIVTTRTLTGAPFGVNLFVPSSPGDPAEVAGYAAALQPEAERLRVALGVVCPA